MILYKYSSEAGIGILEDLCLKVTPPNELNDPFEFTPRSLNSTTRKHLSKMVDEDPEQFRTAYYENRMLAEKANVSFEDFLSRVRTMPRKLLSQTLEQIRMQLADADLDHIHKASNYTVVLSLSATCNSIPMWSHYANKHRGFAIGFDANDTCFHAGSQLLQVKYRARRVAFRPLEHSTEGERLQAQVEVISTKSADWQHEKEYRFLYLKDDVIRRKPPGFPYFIHIWPRTVVNVVLGCAVTDEFERAMRKVLSEKRFAHVKLLRATRHPHHFKLEIKPA